VQRLRASLFPDALSGLVTATMLLAALWAGWRLLAWGLLDAETAADPDACRAAAGACWGVVRDKYRLVFLGRYPLAEQWRPVAASLWLLGCVGVAALPLCFGRTGMAILLAGLSGFGLLMAGGMAGLAPVPSDLWGGLPLTLFLAVIACLAGVPLGIGLALGRRSSLPLLRVLCTVFIEAVRGVPLITLLEMAGADLKKGRFVLAEGADGSSMTRTIPMELIESGEVLIAYGQNGEMLRPEQGYPLRLVVPGVQGVSWVKYLRRIEVGDAPWAAKDEAIHYVDLMPDGQHRQYTSIQECKSVVTTPSGGQMLLDKGFYDISGLAWSGRGKIRRVDVSVDGGRNWRTARLDGPVMSKCLTRFHLDWVWDGQPCIVQSRAMDETGHVQPTYQQLRAVRGTRSIYHNNAIQSWAVHASGEVVNVQLS
jgi:hypothetical protein